ncbi:hypothetical protein Afil01_57450 [Actinorhabdospora filicis]|uniref:Sulfur carrier protein ThiS n=2 Tax=Actinorhabdospora filicis TaxID=1785913 RepID=A0A9W6SRU7_9ACTN|nr:sulfur carrier protein ThiS [Actinorhabdospora filicis]GLZ80938.1 hypothetical protein Afil01_57450 [Actinorhabdospora filicis]
MNVNLNGATRSLMDDATVADAAALLDVRPGRGVAVAVNGEVVPRGEWGRRLREADHVEILRASQGG